MMQFIGPKKSNSQAAHLTCTDANLERAHSRLVGTMTGGARRSATLFGPRLDVCSASQAGNQVSKSGQELLQSAPHQV